MVKFSREYDASIIPEWKPAFVDYRGLKKLIKRIKVERRDADDSSSAGDSSPETAALAIENVGYGSGFSVLDPVRALAARFAPRVQAAGGRGERGFGRARAITGQA
ncbi:unnamed protein product [Triticum turgidum subsp. durum]|uniref:SPX domain-containing protein n=1 Tax=Triticum turgidum subsp. durum TaxID=4567 RepID=A0A9R0Y996_TRITD|nr:unnamed protein product [Triticum turgidum subsp. durum]